MTSQKCQRIKQWCDTNQGQVVVKRERAIFDDWLHLCLGYYLLHIGYWPVHGTYTTTPIKQQYRISDEKEQPKEEGLASIRGHFYELPIKSDTIDTICCQHVVEFAKYPDKMLHEVERVLVPGGHLLLSCFNPLSLWSLEYYLRAHQLPRRYFIRVGRILDWLNFLGFDVLAVSPFVLIDNLPKRIQGICQQIYPYAGGSVCIYAKKRAMTLTPIKYKWQLRDKIIASGLAPTNYRTKDDRVEN